MIEIRIKKDKEWERVAKALKQYPTTSTREFNLAIRKSVLEVQRQTMKEAPVNKKSGGGNLRQSIRSSVRNLFGMVKVWAEYAIYVHEGTRPHKIVARRKKVLADRREGKFFGKVVNHPGTRPNPFLRRGVEKSLKKISGFFSSAMERITSLK